jgi:hypothetical protein
MVIQVLETVRKEEKKREKSWLCAANTSSVWHTRMSGGAPGWSPVKRPLSGVDGGVRLKFTRLSGGAPHCLVRNPWRTRCSREKQWSDVAIIHRAVRWANGRQRQRSATLSSRDTWSCQQSVGHIELSGLHRTVSGAPTDPRDQRSTALRMERNQAPDMNSRCPVHHSTKGKIGLPSWSSTAPSCLGTIKGTPRRMEEKTKHSLSILKHPDSAPVHSLHCVSDLSSIWVANSVCCVSSSSRDLCVWLCCDLSLVCVALPNLTQCFLCDLYYKGERLQVLEIPRKRENTLRPRLFPFISRNWNLTNGIGYFLEYDIPPLSKVII